MKIDRLMEKIRKHNELWCLANEYRNKSMWSYIEDYKEEFKKPNQVNKSRIRAIDKQCYKRAKKELKS